MNEPTERTEWQRSPLLLAAAVAFQIVTIAWSGGHVLCADEARYAWAVSQSWHEMFAWIKTDNHPPLFLSLLKLWSGTFGISELALRMVNVLFVVPLTCAVWDFLKRFPAATAGTIFILFATNPLMLFLMGIAKYYIAFMLVCFLATRRFLEILNCVHEGGSLGALLLARWFICCALLPWVHYLGLIPIGIFGIYLVVNLHSRAARAALGAMILGVATFLPWAYVLAHQLAETQATAPPFIGSYFMKFKIRFIYAIYAFVLGPTLEFGNFIPVVCGAAALMLAVGAIFLNRKTLAESWQIRFLLWFAAINLLLALILMMIVIPGHPDLSMPERVSFILPQFIIVCGFFCAQLPRVIRAFCAVLYGIACLFSVAGLAAWNANNSWDYVIPWHKIQADVRQTGTPDLLIFDSYSFGALGWYYLRPLSTELTEVRVVRESGLMDAMVKKLDRSKTTIFVRSTRDATPGRSLDQVEVELLKALGEPRERLQYLKESEAMKTLKKLLRRGTSIETYDEKIEMLIYRPEVSSSSSD